MRRSQKNKFMLLLVITLGIMLGYALISTTLKINGIATINKHEWYVYWGEPTVTAGSVTTTAPTRGEDESDPANTKLTWDITLDKFDDFYEFTVDATNNGTLDAMITKINITTMPTLPNYIKYEVTYDDGTTPALHDLLPKKYGVVSPTKKYKVKVYYDRAAITRDLVNSITTDQEYTFNFEVTYARATKEYIPVRDFEMGDYFTLTPDLSTYTIQATDTGYTDDQTIDPSELNLWRVININNDGTYDAVSEYASSTSLLIVGTDAYKNYESLQQTIASKYAKANYTVGTRMMGYNGQTLSIDNSLMDILGTANESTTNTPTTTSDNIGEEYTSGLYGDTLQQKDCKLVADIYKTDTTTYGSTGLKAYDKNGNAVDYSVSSRIYFYAGPQKFVLAMRVVGNDGNYSNRIIYTNNSGWNGLAATKLRPIITVKSGLVKSGGEGTKTNPYTFE